jgi:tetratricopeptide (TPR) repeat protein
LLSANRLGSDVDPETRPEHQSKAIEHLQRAVDLDPTNFDNLYHLSFVQAELRDVESSIVTVRKAIILSPSRKEAWHLLALLSTARKEWDAGLKLADAGVDGDPAPRVTTYGEQFSNDKSSDDTLSVPDVTGNQLDTSTETSPESDYPIDETDLLEAEIQFRMTRNVIVETVEGPEAALQDQQAVFQLFSQATSQLKPVHHSAFHPSCSVKSVGLCRVSYSLSTEEVPTTSDDVETEKRHRVSLLQGRRVSLRSRHNDMPRDQNTANRHSSALGVPGAVWVKRSASTNSKASRGSQGSGLGRKNLTVEDGDASAAHRSQESLVSYVTVTDDSATSKQPPTSYSTQDERDPRLTKLLIDLWLMSAASFRRWGKLEEALGAIREAEALDPTDGDVWVQVCCWLCRFIFYLIVLFTYFSPAPPLKLALYHIAHSDRPSAISCLQKSMSFTDDLSHVASQVHLARLFILDGSYELAEGVLRHVTQTQGWNVPEAWYLLAKCYEGPQPVKAKEYLEWALKLERTKPSRDLRKALPTCL